MTTPTGSDPAPAPPDPGAVASRAEGRPPEEAASDDPEAQAEAVLAESEERLVERAAEASPDPAGRDERRS